MIEDIAKANGLVVSRVAHETSKKLSEIVKEVLNDHFCHVNLLEIARRV